MARISKKRKESLSKYDSTQTYSLADASGLVKEITNSNYDATVVIVAAVMYLLAQGWSFIDKKRK